MNGLREIDARLQKVLAECKIANYEATPDVDLR